MNNNLRFCSSLPENLKGSAKLYLSCLQQTVTEFEEQNKRTRSPIKTKDKLEADLRDAKTALASMIKLYTDNEMKPIWQKLSKKNKKAPKILADTIYLYYANWHNRDKITPSAKKSIAKSTIKNAKVLIADLERDNSLYVYFNEHFSRAIKTEFKAQINHYNKNLEGKGWDFFDKLMADAKSFPHTYPFHLLPLNLVTVLREFISNLETSLDQNKLNRKKASPWPRSLGSKNAQKIFIIKAIASEIKKIFGKPNYDLVVQIMGIIRVDCKKLDASGVLRIDISHILKH